jgi:uncharacterized protein with ATP-grasp and redox domains
MLIKPDCIPCILRMSVSAMRRLSLDEDIIKELLVEILNIPSLKGQSWSVTSADVIEIIMRSIMNATGNPDPFHSEKLQQNKMVAEIYPYLKGLIEGSSDPLNMAVKLAILGNSIDLMMDDSNKKIEDWIAERLEAPLSKKSYAEFEAKLRKTKLLLYFGDNAGEIVFDKLLIKTIKKAYDTEIFLVVRSFPTLNDVTLNDARSVGIDEAVTLVENGIDGPLPGTILSRCSDRVNELVNKSDIIISKGGGNFDTLEEEPDHLKDKIIFMLLSKCHPYYEYFGVPLHQPILANS